MSRRSRFVRFMASFATLLIIHLVALQPVAHALSSPGTSIAGRVSWITLDCPGGVKVNTFLGNLAYPRLDLYLAGRGLPIAISLTYNADSANMDTGFGNGWRFSYQISVRRKSDDTIIVQWGDGRRDPFQPNGGSYTPLNEGVFATLQQVGGNQLLLTTKEHTQYLFALPAQNASANIQQMQDPDGNALTFAYDASGNLTTITNALGRSVTLQYTGSHVTSITDPNTSPARMVQYAYDGTGNQIGYTDAVGAATTYAYDASNRITSMTDALGITTIQYSGPHGSVSNVSRSSLAHVLVSSHSFAYDTIAHATTVTDRIDASTSSVTRYLYDNNRRIQQITDPNGNNESIAYDGNGNLTNLTDANANQTRYAYDGNGNLLSRTDPMGHTTTYTYEPTFNHVLTATDPRNNTTTFQYDATGHLTTSTDPLGNTISYAYNGFGEQTSREDANHFSTLYTYNEFSDGSSIQRTDPLGNTSTTFYDGIGRTTESIDGVGNTANTSYTSISSGSPGYPGAIVQTTYSDGTTMTRTYDANHNLTHITDPNTDRSYSYDANNRLLQDTDNLLNKTTTYAYDGLGRRIQMTDSTGAGTSYAYDRAGHLLSITRNADVYRFAYDKGGRRLGVIRPNFNTTLYAYDTANRLTSVTNRRSDNTILSSFAYQYDGSNNRIGTTLVTGEQINTFYDADNRLIEEQRTGGSNNYDNQFGYDGVGNRTTENANGVITQSLYDRDNNLTQQTTGASTTTYGYNANGSRVTMVSEPHGRSAQYAYDARNRTTMITYNDGTMDTSVYGTGIAGSLLIQSTDRLGIVTNYTYDDRQVETQSNSNGTPSTSYLNDPMDGGRHLAEYVGNTRYDYLYDSDSVRQVVDASQTVRNSYDYDSWGTIRSLSETVSNDITFNGRRLDRDSGFYDYQPRLYDPSIGNFTQTSTTDESTLLTPALVS
ncbi:MAG TPA: DUF6531 domain-containing protein, partial [Chthonomonadaceae bacterium]|nr:DUF6531 domain-containing protein [Chthonomonadaceae bacterium]